MLSRCDYVRIVFVLLLYAELFQAERIGCKDENGNNVDWFINYKLPKIKDDSQKDISEGVAYAYILAPGSKKWTLSTKNVLPNSNSMIQNTLDAYYDKEEHLTYIFYNDDPPKKNSKGTGGHAKGVLVFDGKTGFWLIHSIPNFPDHKEYDYPESGENYGQTALCVTFKTSELNNIITQLLFTNPNIYAKALTDEVERHLDEDARSLFTKKPALVTKEPFKRISKLKSLGGESFVSFVKDNQLPVDLYSQLIMPTLRTSLMVETWRKGSGGILDKECKTDLTVVDIKSIRMSFVKGRKNVNVDFDYTQDHSKWAISDEKNEHHVCIADLNRMISQGKRGGGALCFESPAVSEAFDSIIADNDQCEN